MRKPSYGIHGVMEPAIRIAVANRGIYGGAWEPTDIGGCVLWLRSDLGVTKDGDGKVSSWADQSGNGHDITQANGDSQPLWVDNQLNGYPCIRFDGINDDLKSASFVWVRPAVAYIVFKPITWTHADRIFDGYEGNAFSLFQSQIEPRYYMYAGQSDWDTKWVTLSNGSPGIIRIRSTPTSGCGIRVNNDTEQASSNGLIDPNGFTLGSFAGTSGWGNQESYEVVGYSVVPSSGEDTQIMNYLNGRYGIY